MNSCEKANLNFIWNLLVSLQLVVSAMVCTTNSPRPTKTDEKKVVPTTQDSPTKKKLKKDEKMIEEDRQDFMKELQGNQ